MGDSEDVALSCTSYQLLNSISSYFYNWPHFCSLLFYEEKNGLGFCPGDDSCVMYLSCAYTKFIYIRCRETAIIPQALVANDAGPSPQVWLNMMDW